MVRFPRLMGGGPGRWLDGKGKQQPELWKRIIGFAWVIIFLTWSTPAFTYVMTGGYSGQQRDEVLPWSFVNTIVRALNGS